MEVTVSSEPHHHTPARLDVRFDSCWEVIDETRGFLVRALAHAIPDPVRLEQIGIAAHELMENAFRYSTRPEVSIRIESDGATITVTVDNVATSAQVEALRQQIDALRATPDALAYYQQKMLESVERDEGSGLGLARIQWEAEMSLDFEIEGERVRVVATGPIAQ